MNFNRDNILKGKMVIVYSFLPSLVKWQRKLACIAFKSVVVLKFRY